MSQDLKRRLKSRHLSMIALGGSLGTGIFITSGSALYMAGAGGALIAYLIMGLLVYILMNSLGEMAAYNPVSGSFIQYASDYVSEPFGFTMGYNYWFNWAITVATELVAAMLIMGFWFPHTNPLIWCALFFGCIIILNLLSVENYGEAEYWLSFFKVLTILIFIIVGAFVILHDLHHSDSAMTNWQSSDAIFHGGLTSLFEVFLLSGFAFQGSELVGIAAGEAENPQKSIPRAIKQVFWRILLFYVLTMFVISCVIPYTDTRLLNSGNSVSLSPFTLLFAHIGLSHAASLMNAVILVAVLSACNADLYSATRILWHMSKEGNAPKIFRRTNRFGVPTTALAATAVFGLLGFLCNYLGSGRLFLWLVNVSSLAGFIAWTGIAVSHYQFRKHYLKQGYALEDLPYQAKGYPAAPLFALILSLIIMIGQAFVLLLEGHFSFTDLAATYIGVPILALIWIGKSISHRRRLNR